MKMKSIKLFQSRPLAVVAIVGFCSGLVVAPGAFAGSSVSNAQVTSVLVAQGGNAGNGGFFVYVSGTPTAGVPSCASQTAGSNPRYAIDPSTSAGKAQIATILEARNAGRTVAITGTGACDVWGDSETVFSVTSQ